MKATGYSKGTTMADHDQRAKAAGLVLGRGFEPPTETTYGYETYVYFQDGKEISSEQAHRLMGLWVERWSDKATVTLHG